MLYTIAPKHHDHFSADMLEGALKLPRHDVVIGYGIDQVDFPVYKADPTPFLPEHLKALSVVNLKSRYRNQVLGWGSKDYSPHDIPPKALATLPIADQAKHLVNTLMEYHNSPALPHVMQTLLLHSAANPPTGMHPKNTLLALASYLAIYAGGEYDRAFRNVIMHQVNPDDINMHQLGRDLTVAAEVKTSHQRVARQFMQDQDARGLTPAQQLAEVGHALINLGMDSPELQFFAHVLTQNSAQYTPAEPTPEPTRRPTR